MGHILWENLNTINNYFNREPYKTLLGSGECGFPSGGVSVRH